MGSVCVSACLSGENTVLRSLTPAEQYTYNKCYVYNVWILLKVHGSKVMTINTFRGDPRPS